MCKLAWSYQDKTNQTKMQLAQCLLVNKDDFLLLFINLKLVELNGSVGCCVEMGLYNLNLLV